MDKATAGEYAVWFLIVLAAGKMVATSLSIGIGGSGGIFAPCLFIGVTSGYAYGSIVDHIFGPGAGQPALSTPPSCCAAAPTSTAPPRGGRCTTSRSPTSCGRSRPRRPHRSTACRWCCTARPGR
jgi:hypothetical protein